MRVREIVDKKEWRDPEREFLQSWDYGEFLKSTGRNILRLQFGEGERPQQLKCIINKTRPGIKSVYIPRVEIKDGALQHILDYFKKQKFAFVRIEPTNEPEGTNYKSSTVQNRQVHNTWILDIDKTEDELTERMHSKTRYNIRLAERRGVGINHDKDLELFWKLNTITTQRNQYKSHPKNYCEKLLKLDNIYQINALYQEVPVASAVVLKYNDTIFYFFGASSNKHRNTMAPYLVQWEIIKLAQRLGCKYYDFWGMAPRAEKGSEKTSCYHGFCWKADHALTGVSRFKAGFSGELKSYPDAKEFILSPFKYKLFNLIQKAKKNRGIVGHPINK